MYWPEEESVSVVPGKNISTDKDEEETCMVRIGKSVYPGKSAATGMLINYYGLVCTHVEYRNGDET